MTFFLYTIFTLTAYSLIPLIMPMARAMAARAMAVRAMTAGLVLIVAELLTVPSALALAWAPTFAIFVPLAWLFGLVGTLWMIGFERSLRASGSPSAA